MQSLTQLSRCMFSFTVADGTHSSGFGSERVRSTENRIMLCLLPCSGCDMSFVEKIRLIEAYPVVYIRNIR